MRARFIIVMLSLFVLYPQTATADCLGCMITYDAPPAPAGPAYFRAYVKKCRAKQADIEGEQCSCGCKREDHTLHRHEYKYHEGKKLTEEPLAPLIKMAQKEKGTAFQAAPSQKKLNPTKSHSAYSSGTGALTATSPAGFSPASFESSVAVDCSDAVGAGLTPPNLKSVTNDFM